MLLAHGDHRERDRDLEERVGGQPAALAAQRPQRAGAPGEQQQHGRGQHHPRPGHERGWNPVVDRDLDEQVRDAPQGRHGGEGDPGASAHEREDATARRRSDFTSQRTTTGAARIITNSRSPWTASTKVVSAPLPKAIGSTAYRPPGVVARYASSRVTSAVSVSSQPSPKQAISSAAIATDTGTMRRAI